MLVTAEARRRFMREAHAAAILDHPNIVPVHEAGELGSSPTSSPPIARAVAFDLAEGAAPASARAGRRPADRDPGPRRAACARTRNPPSRLEAGQRSAPCSAPARTRPRRPFRPGPAHPDFGLAKLTDEDSDLTHSGAPIGSPPYMAPEQAAGRLRDLGPATDVYALGATLYEVLTGHAPFRGETPSETIRQVIDDEPIAPRMLRPYVNRDLETICLHCLNKEAARRYPSAAALADDLERLLAGQPIHARPASLRERGLKWARRRPAHAALVALVAIVGIGAAGGMGWSNTWLRATTERLKHAIDLADRHAGEAERQQRLADEREALADRHLHAAQVRLARQACDLGQFERAQEVLLDDVNGPGPRHLDFAWSYLWRLSRREVALLGSHDAPVRRIDLSPDGRTLASCDAAGGIILWDTPLESLPHHPVGHRGRRRMARLLARRVCARFLRRKRTYVDRKKGAPPLGRCHRPASIAAGGRDRRRSPRDVVPRPRPTAGRRDQRCAWRPDRPGLGPGFRLRAAAARTPSRGSASSWPRPTGDSSRSESRMAG